MTVTFKLLVLVLIALTFMLNPVTLKGQSPFHRSILTVKLVKFTVSGQGWPSHVIFILPVLTVFLRCGLQVPDLLLIVRKPLLCQMTRKVKSSGIT